MGYATGQFGKNHFCDRNEYLPTMHGFDEFWGYLYHLDAMEDPFHHNYPDDLKDKVGPRNLLHCHASEKDDSTVDPRWGKIGNQTIIDEGPLPPHPVKDIKYNMETVDEVILDKANQFMEKAVTNGEPFFCYLNPTRMHVVTNLSEKYQKMRTSANGWTVYEAGMAQLDDIVGGALQKLKDLGIDDNTIVVFTTDNGAENFTWPDGGQTPFAGGKGNVLEGGFRAGYALLRSVLKSGSDSDVAKAITYSKRIKLYLLSQASDPPATKFVDASGVLFDSTIPYDLTFFESLNQMVQTEPWLERDKAMIDQLKTIGIERDKTFNPDKKTKEILEDAIQEAKAWLDIRYETLTPYYQGERWFFPITEEMHQNVMSYWQTPDSFPVDIRGAVYTLAFFSAQHLGESQYYLMTTKDKDGNQLQGNVNYRLNVPASVPVTQYWSMTVYDHDTHAFIRNSQWVGRSSQTPGLEKNVDGSVDIYFGPTSPASGESNWIRTDPNGRFELLARFYGPLKPLFDKTWKLPDIEKTN
jgi:Protein of unknown function (DUF1214)/Sulfatase